jgi:hypothetical protein
LLCGACAPSPQPIPPPDITLGELAIRDAGRGQVSITGLATLGTDFVDVIRLRLDQDAVPSVTTFTPDPEGRFGGEIAGAREDLFRLQALADDGQESGLYDVTVEAGAIVQVDTPLPCLLAPSELSLEATAGSIAAGVLTLDNQCGRVLGIDEIALAVDSDWQAAPVAGQMLGDTPSGEQLDLDVSHQRAAPGRDVNALVVRVFDMQPTPTLRLFTLRSLHTP